MKEYQYMTPEYEALKMVLDRTSAMQKLSVDLLRQEKITQRFLKRYLEEVLDAYFDIEHYAVEAMRHNREYAGNILELEERIRILELKTKL